MKALRISLWCPQFQGCNGGIQQYSRLLDRALRSIQAVHSSRALELSGSRHGLLAQIHFAIRVASDLLFRRPDLVMITHLHLGRLSPLLHLLHIRYWICAHGIECWSVSKAADLRTLAGAERVLCVSGYTEQMLLSALPALAGKTRILPNHVEKTVSRPSRSQARKILVLPMEGRLLLTVSRLSSAESYKGHREILAALPELLADHPDLFYVIAGDGDDRINLQSIAIKANIIKRVIFLGALDDAGLEAAYAAADAFVMPSTGEGFGIVFLEALVRGLPVLAGNRDGSRDPLQNGEAGILVDPLDPVSLQAGLRELLSRRWDSARLAEQTLSQFDVHLLGPRLSQLLEETRPCVA